MVYEKQKTTKRALISSIVSLMMCLTMLIGTTFAWFTDTATTAVNRIVSGTLEVAIVDEDGNDLTAPLQWEKAAGHEAEEVLWEPGATYNLQKFRIQNKGNLALKYKVASIPTLLLFKNGEVVATNIGFIGEEQVMEFIGQ